MLPLNKLKCDVIGLFKSYQVNLLVRLRGHSKEIM